MCLSKTRIPPLGFRCFSAMFVAFVLSGIFSACERSEPTQQIPVDTTQGYSEVDTLERELNTLLMEAPAEQRVQVIDSFFSNKNHIPFAKERHLAYRAAHFLRLQQHQLSIADLDSLISIASKNEHLRQVYAEALFNKADILLMHGKYIQAYDYYKQAGEIAVRTKNPCISSMFDYRIAMVLYRQEYYDRAISYFNRSKSTYLLCDNSFLQHYRVQEIYDNIGLCYFKKRQFGLAQQYFDSTLYYISNMPAQTQVSRKEMLEAARAVVYSNKANTLLMQGDTTAALNYYSKSLTPALKAREKEFIALTLLRVTQVYTARGYVKEAERSLQQAEEMALLELGHIKPLREDMLKARWELSVLKNEKDAALRYATAYWKFKDSVEQQEKDMQANNIHLSLQEFEYNEREKVLLQEAKNREERLLLSIIVAIAAFIATMVSVYSWLKTRSQNKELVRLNKQIEDQSKTIRQTYEDLKVLDQAKDRIMGIVAHDLRNPISAIYSMATLLREQAAERKDEEEMQMTNLVRTACESSLELIQEIMMVADLQHNKGVVKKQRVSINEFVDTTVKLIRFKSAEKKQTIQVLLPPVDAEVLIGPDQIRRVLNNLLVNAIKFSKEGSNIVVRSYVHDNLWRVEVADQGIGIPAAMRNNIFEMFTKAKRAGTSGEKPFGLGLSIVKQIVEAHGGRIWFESEEGAGSTFFVELPAE